MGTYHRCFDQSTNYEARRIYSFPSHVDDYNSLCQAMCHARSRTSKSAIKNVECIPTHCLLKVDYLLANNVNSSDKSVITVATKGGDITRRKRDREIVEDLSNENMFRSAKRSRVDELDFALKEERVKTPCRMKMSYWVSSKMGNWYYSEVTHAIMA